MILDTCLPIALPQQLQGNQPNQCTSGICAQKAIETTGFMVKGHLKMLSPKFGVSHDTMLNYLSLWNILVGERLVIFPYGK